MAAPMCPFCAVSTQQVGLGKKYECPGCEQVFDAMGRPFNLNSDVLSFIRNQSDRSGKRLIRDEPYFPA